MGLFGIHAVAQHELVEDGYPLTVDLTSSRTVRRVAMEKRKSSRKNKPIQSVLGVNVHKLYHGLLIEWLHVA